MCGDSTGWVELDAGGAEHVEHVAWSARRMLRALRSGLRAYASHFSDCQLVHVCGWHRASHALHASSQAARAEKIQSFLAREKKLHFHALAPPPPPPPPVDPPTMALLFRRAFATTAPNLAVKNVTVYGSGLMGSGIVQVRRAEAHRGRTTAQSADVGRCVRRAGRPRMRADCRGRGLQGHHGRRQRRRPQEGPQPHREEPAGTLPRPCQSALNTPAAALTRAPARRRAVYAAPAPSVWPTKNSRTSRPTRRST